MEVNRLSLSKLYQCCQASGSTEPHSVRTHRTAGASSPLSDTCPLRMEVFPPHCAADIKQKSHCELPSGWRLHRALRHFLFSLCFPLPLLSLQLMGRRKTPKRMCAPVLTMSYRNRRESQRGEEYLHACEYLFCASQFTYIITFNHRCNYFSHFKDMQTETDSNHSSMFAVIAKRNIVKPLTSGLRISDWNSA